MISLHCYDDHTMPELPSQIAPAYNAFPEAHRKVLLTIRDLIFNLAETTDGVGEVTENLKWGQPSYLAKQPKTGTPIRLGITKSGKPAIFTHCQTTVVSDFQSQFPNDFTYEGNRAVIIGDVKKQEPLIRAFIGSALTYHKK